MTSSQNIKRPKSFYLFGYNGKRNTGSDARLVCIIEQLRESFGDDCKITVATFDVDSTSQNLKRFSNVKLAHIHPLAAVSFFWNLATHDATVLVEGSTFKQNFSQALLHVFLTAAWFARLMGRRCIAYAVDVGELTPMNRFLTRRVCQPMALLITRSDAARDKLVEMGITREIPCGTDPAFPFEADEAAAADVKKLENGLRRFGVAPIEFYHWPVRYRLYGPKSQKYQWPHYFSWDAKREAQSEKIITAWVELIRHAQTRHDYDISLIAMEALDEAFCRKIMERLTDQERSRVQLVSSRAYTPHVIVPHLRSLDFLATSRYHACVLSMKTGVPQMALAHDERLRAIYAEAGLADNFLLSPETAGEPGRMTKTFDLLVEQQAEVKKLLDQKFQDFFLPRCYSNVQALKDASVKWEWQQA